MKPIILAFKVIFIIQVINVVGKTNAKYEHHIAFNCGRPTMIFRNDKWIVDFKQDCIKNEREIVSYCQHTFPNQNISSAEPATERVKFARWCDFDGKNCELDVKIRPFKCLESNFQSDALTLPKHCLFAHLGGKGGCKIYTDWVLAARKQCSEKSNWKVKSYGMLFQCGDVAGNVKPMFFKGVEFVCCPPNSVNKDPSEQIFNEQNIYKDYLSNGILQSKESEDQTYLDALEKMKQKENQSKAGVIDNFKNGIKYLTHIWKQDPERAKTKEHELILLFKRQFNAMIDQYRENKEQLLNFHDDRRKFFFTTKFQVALKQLNDVLKKSVKNEMEILDSMKQVLDLLNIRKKELLEEQLIDESLDSHLIDGMKNELKIIERNITDVLNKLDQVPQFKDTIKRHLLMYLASHTSRDRNVEKNINNEADDIIAKYKHRPEPLDDGNDDDFQVHYDLGLHNKDQQGHYGKEEHKFIFDRESFVKQYSEKRLLFGLVFGTLVTAFVILLVGALLIMYRHRSTVFKYNKPSFQDEPSKQMMHGFGIESSSVGKDIINGKPFNVYENPTYKVIQTALDTEAYVMADQQVNDHHQENLSSPLIQS